MASMAAFIKVFGTGSFSAAARECRCPQALVTKQIQELESWHSGFLTGQRRAPHPACKSAEE